MNTIQESCLIVLVMTSSIISDVLKWTSHVCTADHMLYSTVDRTLQYITVLDWEIDCTTTDWSDRGQKQTRDQCWNILYCILHRHSMSPNCSKKTFIWSVFYLLKSNVYLEICTIEKIWTFHCLMDIAVEVEQKNFNNSKIDWLIWIYKSQVRQEGREGKLRWAEGCLR